jgi:RHS repeat-associated protein
VHGNITYRTYRLAVTNNLGFNVTATYNYGDATSAERVTSITVPNAPTTDTFVYDRRGRGLIAQHKLSATQTIAQDAYEYDSQNRLTAISHLGAKLEDLAYDGAGDLVSRTFPTGAAEIARYYIGDQLSLVNRSATTKLGYAHIQLGGKRIASFWVKSASGTNTNGVIYYHRDRRNDVVATTKNGGSMGVSYRYLPYGALDKVVNNSGTALTPGTEADDVVSELGFIGGLKLSGGLIHLKARAYSPTLRRFLQPDTIELRRYTYSSSDPLNLSDPSGREALTDGTSEKNEKSDGGDGAQQQQRRDGGTEEIVLTGNRTKKQDSGCDGGNNCGNVTGPTVPLAPPAAPPAVPHRIIVINRGMPPVTRGRGVSNRSKTRIWVKPEKTGEAVPVQPGQAFDEDADGVAVPAIHPDEVFKTVDGIETIVNEDGSPSTSGNPLSEVIQAIRGGWKDAAWNADLNANNDIGWNELFTHSHAAPNAQP